MLTCEIFHVIPVPHPVERGRVREQLGEFWQLADVKCTAAGTEFYKQLQLYPDHFMHMNNSRIHSGIYSSA